MKLDSLARLIESADFSSFREIALLYLRQSGYREAALRDGPRDLGNDIDVWSLGANPEPLVVQVSVQRSNWQSKLRKDVEKAVGGLGRSQFVYLTSRRIAASDAQPVIDELWAKQSVGLRIVDVQVLASKFHLDGLATDVLERLGVAPKGGKKRRAARKGALRDDLAYAYAFFGTDVNSFREEGIDRSIVAFLTGEPEAPTREATISGVARALRLTGPRERLIGGRLDRLLQKGDVLSKNARLSAANHLADSHRAARLLRGRQQRELEADLARLLGEAGIRGGRLERATASASTAAGALMLNAALGAQAAIQQGGDTGPAKNSMRAQLRRLERDLVDAGLDRGDAPGALASISRAISQSEVGRNLMAGDLFLSLVRMEENDLMQALGGSEELEVFLDASVAMPMLASLLFEPHENHFFRAASHVHALASQTEITLSLPRDYLEEAASHLLDAYELYAQLVETESNLRFSQNVFVAHFASLRHEGRYSEDFATYVSSFGWRPPGAGTRQIQNRPQERDWIMQRMQTLFARYGIGVVQPRTVPRQAMGAAQQAISFTARELDLDRAGRLLEHDARAVADISARATAGEHAVMFCTWDRLHLQLRTAGGAVDWNALDPVMLSDLLALISPETDEPAEGVVNLALEFGDVEARRAAQIWDELVRIEKDSLYDGDVLERARAFKDNYLDAIREDAEREPLAAAWTAWKAG